MNNEVFSKAQLEVQEFEKEYQAKLAEAEKQLQDLEEKKAQADLKAGEAVASNDQKTWRAADQQRMDAAAGIKFTNERIDVIKAGQVFPLAEYTRLLDHIEVEKGRALLAFVKSLQEAYKQCQAAYTTYSAIFAEGEKALAALYSAGGSEEDGYTRLTDREPNWLFIMRRGDLLTDDLLKINTESGEGDGGDPVARAVNAAVQAIRREEADNEQ